MKKRIIISATSDLVTDQRVLKVSRSCFDAGYDVLLIGRRLKNSLPFETIFQHKRIRLLFNRSALFYIEFNVRLFFILLFSRADILLSNDTDTLPANFLMSRVKNKKLVFDAHELFPELPELANRPKIKKIWESIENNLFPHLKYCYTVCDSIANYYNNKYHISMKVIRNVPYLRKEEAAISQQTINNKKIILYQGALNTGRGLEWVINAMPFVENGVLMIIGDGDIKSYLEEQVKRLNLQEKVIFSGKIAGNILHKYTKSAHLGLCLLENKGLSYYYSLPNRIFDYLHAGIPVLATRFPEIEKIVETYDTGVLINHYEPEYLAETINNQLKNKFDTSHFKPIASNFCWEKEEKILISILYSCYSHL